MPEQPGNISTVKVRQRREQSDPEWIPALTIVSHGTLSRAGERLVFTESEVAISRMAPDFSRRGASSGKPLEDPGVSRKPFTIARTPSGGVVFRVDDGGTTVEVNGERLVGQRELPAAALAAGVPVVLSSRVVLLLHLVDPGHDRPSDDLGMVGDSDALRQVREQIRNALALDAHVLVRGESGTGKEKVAEALHRLGPRRRGPFVSVNLASLAKELAASELFGVKKGAFTHADKDRDGFFQAAKGGTLFLDEVGEALPELQVLLLRVLETNELYRVGDQAPVKVDVRLVTATDANLEARIQDGRFRLPLLHRLAGYEIHLPALRERREDIGQLFAHFAREELEKLGETSRLTPDDPRADPWFPAGLALAFLRCLWPGNIRQLQNVTRRLIVGSRGRPVLKADAWVAAQLGLSAPGPMTPATPLALPAADPNATPAPRRKPSDVTREELLAALRACKWDRKAAAAKLQISRASIYPLIDKLVPDLHTAGELSDEEIAECHQECGGSLEEMMKRLEVSRAALKRRCKELDLACH